MNTFSEKVVGSWADVLQNRFPSQNAGIVYVIGLYLFLKNWSIPQQISVRSVKINFSNCNRRN